MANARNVSFQFLYAGQFTLSTHFIDGLQPIPKGPFTHAIFGAIFVALSNATFIAKVN